jgi:hypothetical protein
MRGEERPDEGAGHSRQRGHGKKTHEPVQAKNQKYQPKKDSCDDGNYFHRKYLPSVDFFSGTDAPGTAAFTDCSQLRTLRNRIMS